MVKFALSLQGVWIHPKLDNTFLYIKKMIDTAIYYSKFIKILTSLPLVGWGGRTNRKYVEQWEKDSNSTSERFSSNPVDDIFVL